MAVRKPHDAAIANRVGVHVKRLREAAGLTPTHLADLCASAGHTLDRTSIQRMEAGERPTVSVADVLVLAKFLEVSPTYLLTELPGEDSPVTFWPDDVPPQPEPVNARVRATIDKHRAAAVLWLRDLQGKERTVPVTQATSTTRLRLAREIREARSMADSWTAVRDMIRDDE